MTDAPDNFDDPKLDTLLASHLHARLGGQVGRAAAAFQQRIDAETHAREVRRTRRAWFLSAIPAAVAAGLVIIATVGRFGTTEVSPGKTPVALSGVSADTTVNSTTYYRDFDAGVRVVGDAREPVRQIVRQVLRETEWYDPVEKATIRVTVPAEEVVHVKVQPY